MKKCETSFQATYGPQTYKTLEGALFSFFRKECPQMGGERIVQMLTKTLTDIVDKFRPTTTHLKSGQVTWPTIHKDTKASYGKRIQDCEIVPVVLTLIGENDAKDRAGGKKLRDMKIETTARLCKESYAQNGCITVAELSLLMKISPCTACKYIAEWEDMNKEVLPRRGSIHDMGPTFTHKKIIIQKLFFEQKSMQQTARETYHSYDAISNYITTFRQVYLCKSKGMNTQEIALATKRTVRLVKEYEKIIDEFSQNSSVIDKIINSDVKIENNIEQWVNEYGS